VGHSLIEWGNSISRVQAKMRLGWICLPESNTLAQHRKALFITLTKGFQDWAILLFL